MGTLDHSLRGGGIMRLSGEALFVDEIRAPNLPVLTIEAGDTAEIVISVSGAAAWRADLQGVSRRWYTLDKGLLILHPPHDGAASPPGDYNFVLQVWTANEPTAVAGRLRLVAPGGTTMSSRYLAYLPGVFAESDPFLGRFLLVFESVLDPIEDLVDNAHLCLDPDFAPIRFLPWLARWVGVDLDPTMDETQQRQYVRRAVEMHKWKGTRRALAEELETVLGVRALIVENFDGLRLGHDAVLGVNSQLGQRQDRSVAVTLVGSRPGAIDPLKAGELIEGLIPADVTHALRLVTEPAGLKDGSSA